MVSHHPARFGDHGYCGSEDVFLVAEKENSRCSRFNRQLPVFVEKKKWTKIMAIAKLFALHAKAINRTKELRK